MHTSGGMAHIRSIGHAAFLKGFSYRSRFDYYPFDCCRFSSLEFIVAPRFLVMYNPDAYNLLPSLRTAAARVDERVRTLLNGSVRQYFLEHAAHEEYGVALLHKHFPISDTKRLVDYSHSSTAWKVDKETDIVPQHYGHIVPRSTRLA
jgi:hypothetical protein